MVVVILVVGLEEDLERAEAVLGSGTQLIVPGSLRKEFELVRTGLEHLLEEHMD
jgi:hypothetical protein